jgi:branched-chain amino acid aminotransferase
MPATSFPYAFFQGKVVPIEDAKVSIMTNALQYGTAIFGGIRAYYSAKDKATYVFRLEDHYKRLLASADILGCPIPYSLDQLKATTIELITKNHPDTDAYLRPYAYVGNTSLGPNLANTTLDFALYMIPLDEYLSVSKGLKLTVSSWRRVSDNAIPARAKASGAYINSALARKEADDGGFDEAILLHENGNVSEGSAENIFLVRDGVLISPSPVDGILEGITRRSILKIAADLGIPTEVRSVAKSELYAADEVILTGTGCQVAWTESIDKRTIGTGKIGPVTKQLQDKFFGIVRGTDPDYSSWLTKINLK